MNRFICVLLLLLTAFPATADNIKISELPLGTGAGIGPQDSFPYVQSNLGITRRVKIYDLINVPALTATFAPLASPSFTGTVTAPTFSGNLTGSVAGNASTASALAANPTDCAAGSFASSIDAMGNLTCLQVQTNQLGGTITNDQLAGGIAYGKLNLTGALVNADIASAAGIDLSKLASLTANRAIISNGSGVLAPSAVTNTELGYVSGATSNIQNQISTNGTAISTHTGATSNAHAASAISSTATGSVTATDVQAAIGQLEPAKARTANVVAPSAGKAFEVASTTGAFVGPRMTTVQRDAIPSPAAGYEIYNTTTSKKQIYSGTGWTDVGSGSGGGGGVNYAPNGGNFDSGMGTYTTYSNPAAALPTTASGGTPTNTSIALVPNGPNLGGLQNLVLSKAAANAQGEGLSAPFTIAADDAFVGSIQQIAFSVVPTAGTYQSGDIVVGVIDTTSGAILASQQLYSNVSKFYLSYPLTSTNTTYRFFAHVASTSASAYSLAINRVSLGPIVQAAPTAYIAQPDSIIRINGFSFALGSTANKIFSFTSGTITENVGDAIQYLDDSVNGARFIANRDGNYEFNLSFQNNGTGGGYGLSKNTTQPTAQYGAIPGSEKLVTNAGGTGTALSSLNWSGPLKAGDIIRVHNFDISATANTTLFSQLSFSYSGGIKSITAIPNQKIQIPNSELVLGNSDARGTGVEATTIRFSKIAKISGDAYSIDSSNGTIVTMRKAGLLTIAAANLNLSSAQTTVATKNVVSAAAVPTDYGDETVINTATGGSAWFGTVAGQVRVAVGDKIRIQSSQNPSNGYGIFRLSFFETEISLSLNTVQPQWSQSDSSIRLQNSVGFGTTNVRSRRFSNVLNNVGSAISYIDSPTLGTVLTANEDGIYSVSYTEAPATASTICVMVNYTGVLNDSCGNYPAANILTRSAAPNGYANNAVWSGFLSKGDTLLTNVDGSAGSQSNNWTQLTVAKVGKPNLTSVDVTPFATNYKTTDTESIFISGTPGNGSTNTGVARFSTVVQNTNLGIVQYVSDAALGDSFIVKKSCTLGMSAFANVQASASNLSITKNSTVLNSGVTAVPMIQTLGGGAQSPGGYMRQVSANTKVSAGDILRVQSDGASGLYTGVNLTCVADTDAVVSTNKQVSSDSMTFAFKSTAINPDTDPVGTFNTYTYSGSSNTPTLATTAPTQTSSSMNANGVQLFGRLFPNATSAAQPARFDIFIGKGLKASDIQGYAGLGKTLPGNFDIASISSVSWGIRRMYNETTGILTFEAAHSYNGGETVKNVLLGLDGTGYSNGYFVFNASANPALLSVPTLTKRVAILRDEKASGTAGGTSTTAYTARNLNTIKDPSGLISNPSSFTGVGGTNSNFGIASGGNYKISVKAPFLYSDLCKAKLVNVSDSTDVSLGTGAIGNTSANSFGALATVYSIIEEIVSIPSAKTFAIQGRCSTSRTSDGLGPAASFGDNEVFTIVTVEKLN